MENSHKEKSTMHLMSQYHPPKTPVGKNGWYDITLCWYYLIKNFIWETQREKLIQRKECNMIFTTSYEPERLSPLILANLKVNSYQCTQHIRNVECVRLCEYLSEIITILSLQMFICPYYLWNRTILVQKYCIKYNLSPSIQHKLYYLYR